MSENTDEGRQLLAELVKMRSQKNLRQIDVAQAMGVGQPSVSEFERADTSPRIDTLQRYAKAVGARIEFKVVTEDDE